MNGFSAVSSEETTMKSVLALDCWPLSEIIVVIRISNPLFS